MRTGMVFSEMGEWAGMSWVERGSAVYRGEEN